MKDVANNRHPTEDKPRYVDERRSKQIGLNRKDLTGFPDHCLPGELSALDPEIQAAVLHASEKAPQ